VFGKGIYFTTNALSPNITEDIIISFVYPGEIYPVVATDVSSLCGTHLKNGYNSHYVLTKKDGTVPTKQIEETFDQIVIGNSILTVPVFLIKVEDSTKQQVTTTKQINVVQ